MSLRLPLGPDKPRRAEYEIRSKAPETLAAARGFLQTLLAPQTWRGRRRQRRERTRGGRQGGSRAGSRIPAALSRDAGGAKSSACVSGREGKGVADDSGQRARAVRWTRGKARVVHIRWAARTMHPRAARVRGEDSENSAAQYPAHVGEALGAFFRASPYTLQLGLLIRQINFQ